MTLNFKAFKFDNASEAIQETDASGRGVAIYLRGDYLVVNEEDAHRLEAAGVEFAYLGDHEGRIMTVPVND